MNLFDTSWDLVPEGFAGPSGQDGAGGGGPVDGGATEVGPGTVGAANLR